jgi:hypothetical protein
MPVKVQKRTSSEATRSARYPPQAGVKDGCHFLASSFRQVKEEERDKKQSKSLFNSGLIYKISSTIN